MCKFIKDLFTKEWTFDDKVLIVSIGTLIGIIVGFVISPIKQGISMMSGNGCYNSGNKSVSSISRGRCRCGEKKEKNSKKNKKDKSE